MPESAPRIDRRLLFAVWWRWLFFAHANYNWETYQATGLAHALTPLIRRLYRDPAEIRSALRRHLALFSTDPELGALIVGMAVALEERRAAGDSSVDDASIQALKSSLMGPLGAVGDTLKQGLWFPLWQALGIGIALSAGGSVSAVVGPALVIVTALVYTLAFSWLAFANGYRRGRALLDRVLQRTLLDDVRTGGAVLGTAVLAALAAQAVVVQSGITWNDADGRVLDLQTQFLDVLYPALLPLLLVVAVIRLFRRGASAVAVALLLFGVGFASALLEAVSRATVQAGLFGLFSPAGLPALLGIVLLLAGAYIVGWRARHVAAARYFIAVFVLLGVVVALLSLGRAVPLQLLAHP